MAKYFIRKRGAYFWPEGKGYTTDITNAGIFGDADPQGYVRLSQRDKSAELELVPVETLLPFLRRARDLIAAKLAELGGEDGPVADGPVPLYYLREPNEIDYLNRESRP